MKIILDTDIGDDIDDVYALNLLLCEDKTEMLGVTTVYRNATQRAKIVKTFLDLYQKDIPVYIGEDFPIKESLKPFENAKKDERGIWGIPHYNENEMSNKKVHHGAVEFIANSLLDNPYEITLVAIGPLTNIAKVATQYPEAFSKAKELLVMGGNYTEISPEWNILCDPESAKIVFESGINIKAVGLDITKKCAIYQEILDELRSMAHRRAKLLITMTDLWIKHNETFNLQPIMHDPLTVSELNNKFCKYTEAKVSVALEGELRGCTIVGDEGKTIKYATECNYGEFLKFLLRTLKGALDEDISSKD